MSYKHAREAASVFLTAYPELLRQILLEESEFLMHEGSGYRQTKRLMPYNRPRRGDGVFVLERYAVSVPA